MSNIKDLPVDINDVGDIKNYLEGKSTEDIEGIINSLHAALEEKKRENVRTIYEKLNEDITTLGFETIHDFIAAAEAYGIIKSNRTPRRPIPIRYRSTENAEHTWTGRGKQPKWLQALLAKGRKIEEFEVPPEELEQDDEAVEQEKATKKPKVQKKTAAASDAVAEETPKS